MLLLNIWLHFKSEYKTENNGDIVLPSPRWASKVESFVFNSQAYRWDVGTHIASEVQNGSLKRIQVSLNSKRTWRKKNLSCCCSCHSVNRSMNELNIYHESFKWCILNKLLGSFPAFDFCSREIETSSNNLTIHWQNRLCTSSLELLVSCQPTEMVENLWRSDCAS